MIPATDTDITEAFMAVRRRKPSFPGFAYGFLYGTASTKRRTVAVAYNYGVEKLSSVRDLYVHYWVPGFWLSANVVDMSAGHVVVTTMPGSRVPLEFPYSIFYVPRAHHGHHQDPNECRSLRAPDLWRGNILVVKHGKRKAAINMAPEDAYLVDNLVSAYIDNGILF